MVLPSVARKTSSGSICPRHMRLSTEWRSREQLAEAVKKVGSMVRAVVKHLGKIS